MTETAQELLARLVGFTPGPWKLNPPKGTWCGGFSTATDILSICDFGSDEPYEHCCGEAPIETDAALIAAAPDLHRELSAALAREAALREALEDAEYDICQWLECGPELIKAGFNMDGTEDVIAKVRLALEVQP